jgi:hypothetical protein
MRPLSSAALVAVCLAVAPGARAGTVGPPARSETTRVTPLPTLAAVIGELAWIARPFRLAAATTFTALADLRGATVAREDSDPCAQW